jgi:hypothetical protein
MGWLPGLAGCCCCGPAGGTGGGYSVGAVAHRDAIGRMQMPQGRCSGPVLPQASSVIRGELFLLCGFLWRDPLGNLEPRNGRGPVTNMERPLEGGGRCLDLDNTARQFQDLIARRRPRRPVNGTDLDGRGIRRAHATSAGGIPGVVRRKTPRRPATGRTARAGFRR